jgi:outer membrane cobalamin receptor
MKTYMRYRAFLIFLLLAGISPAQAQWLRVSGRVTNAQTGVSLPGASVELIKAAKATLSDENGRFDLKPAKPGDYVLRVTYVGFLAVKQKLNLQADTTIRIQLVPFTQELDEVVVNAGPPTPVQNALSGMHTLTNTQLTNLPSVGSEHDIARALTLLPGVKNDNDGAAGLYVRGGNVDQNLVLLNGVPIYKNNHFLGFLSPLNSDAIGELTLYKGSFPARFGGRLSSVLDVSLKAPNLQRLTVGGSIGILSSRLNVEIPIVKDRVAVLLAGRRSYFDIFTRLISGSGTTEGPNYYFFDLNATVIAQLSARHRLKVFSWQDRDQLTGAARNDLEDQTYYQRWNSRVLGVSLSSSLGTGLTNEADVNWSGYEMSQRIARRMQDQAFANTFQSSIEDMTLRDVLTVERGKAYTARLGLAQTWHRFRPGNLRYEGENLQFAESNLDSLNTTESSVFMENEVRLGGLTVNAGWRITRYAGADFSYLYHEPRLSVSYKIGEQTALKVAYSRMNQPLHQLTNPGLGIPVDLWVSSNRQIRPQQADQVSAGLAHDLSVAENQTISIAIEGYYKQMRNIISYQDGHSATDFTELSQQTVRQWERVVAVGQGESYGAEVFVEKRQGRLSGWVGYTLAWTPNQFADLNGGRPFPARQDRRHTLTLTGTYELGPRWQVNVSWTYQTGQPVTLPKAVYSLPVFDFITGSFQNYANTVYINGERNAYRMAAYHRLDASIQRKTTHRWGIGTWEMSFYNAYNRRNPYFYYLSGGQTVYSVSLFGIIPSFAYTFQIYTH